MEWGIWELVRSVECYRARCGKEEETRNVFDKFLRAWLFWGERNKSRTIGRCIRQAPTSTFFFFFHNHYNTGLHCYTTLLISQISMPPSFSSPLPAVAISKRVSSSFATYSDWRGPETRRCDSLVTAASAGSFHGQGWFRRYF